MSLSIIRKPLYHWRYGRHQPMLEVVSKLKQYQWLNDDELRETRGQRMAALLRHAAANVPYYRETLPKGIVGPGGQVNWELFAQTPYLTKPILRSRFEDLKSADLAQRQWYTNTSGGSTGQPAQFIQDMSYKTFSQAQKIVMDEWAGRQAGERQIRIWGSIRDTLEGKESVKTRVGRWMRNELWLNCFHMDEQDIERFFEAINRFKPATILSYVEAIHELARIALSRNIKLHRPGGIMTTAGVLTDETRRVIEAAFGCPVFNRYGSREVGDMACECAAHKGMHVSEMSHYLEIIREDGTPAAPGETGEIVVTSLVNYAMPLIRYRIGDLGVWSEEPCTCGRRSRLLRNVVGRSNQTFINARGERIHGAFFQLVFIPEEWVRQYQVVQESVDEVTIRIATDHGSVFEEPLAAKVAGIQERIKKVMGEECRFRVIQEDRIERNASGKYIYIMSKVSNPGDGKA